MYGCLDCEKYKLLLYDYVRCNACAKEPETVRWIEQMSKADVVYDVGTSVGPYSLIMSKYAKEVYAFEPAILNYNLCFQEYSQKFLRKFDRK